MVAFFLQVFPSVLLLFLPLSFFFFFLFFFLPSLIRRHAHHTKSVSADRANRSGSGRRLPPSPRKLPIIGNFHQLGAFPHRSLQSLSSRCGAPVMLLRLGRVTAAVVSTASTAREVLGTQDRVFMSRPASHKVMVYHKGVGIAWSPYGPYWREMRKIATVHLLSSKMVQSFQALREEEVKDLVKTVVSRTSPSSLSNRVVDLSEVLFRFAHNVISRAAIGRSGKESELLSKLVEESSALTGFPMDKHFSAMEWLARYVPFINGGRARHASALWEELLSRIVAEHKSSNRDGEGNHLDILLSLEESSSRTTIPTGFTLAEEDIKAALREVLLAGIGTSFAAMEWTLAELAQNPTVQRKLQDELSKVASNKLSIEEEDLQYCKYFKAALKESLRLHPPLPLLLPHESLEDSEIEGFHIPKGTRVYVNAWAIQRDRENWDSPEEFLPERFMKKENAAKEFDDFSGKDFYYIPFGSGRRMCPGSGLAIATVELALANLVYLFEWKLPNGVRELVMEEAPGTVSRMKQHLQLVANPRFITG